MKVVRRVNIYTIYKYCYGSNRTRTHIYLVRKRTLSHLAKLASTSNVAIFSYKEFLDIQTITECSFSLT